VLYKCGKFRELWPINADERYDWNIGNFCHQRSANNGSRERCRCLANADALKKHERTNAFNLVLIMFMFTLQCTAYTFVMCLIKIHLSGTLYTWAYMSSFYARQHAIARICYRPSVRPFLRTSHGWMSKNGWSYAIFTIQFVQDAWQYRHHDMTIFLVQLSRTIDIITRISFTKMISKFDSYNSVVYTQPFTSTLLFFHSLKLL